MRQQVTDDQVRREFAEMSVMTVVVVAEDDADLRTLLTRVVRLAGFEVVDAADGPAGRALAAVPGALSGVTRCRSRSDQYAATQSTSA